MNKIPFAVIEAAKNYEPEAVIYIQRSFESYIVKRCTKAYKDDQGNTNYAVDDDLYYQAQIALFAAIAGFEFREPPEDFEI